MSNDSPALGRKALAVLSKHFADPDPEVRAAVAALWGEIGNPAAAPALQRALKDRDVHVRLEAAYSLHRLGHEAGIAGLEAIVRQGKASGETLTPAEELKLLAKNKARIRAIQRLSEIGGERAVELFERTLRDPSGAVRDATAVALARMGLDEFARQFLDAAAHSDQSVRAAAMQALSEIGGGDALEALQRAASDPSIAVRLEALKGLGRFSDPQAIVLLVRSVKDEDARIRSKALGSLAEMTDEGSIPVLRDVLLEHKAPEIQLRALRGLALRGQSVELDLAAAAIRQKDQDLKQLALQLLRASESPLSNDLLQEMMEQDPEPRFRVQAAAILVRRLQKPARKT